MAVCVQLHKLCIIIQEAQKEQHISSFIYLVNTINVIDPLRQTCLWWTPLDFIRLLLPSDMAWALINWQEGKKRRQY